MGQKCWKSSTVDDNPTTGIANDAYCISGDGIPETEIVEKNSKKYHAEGIMSVVAINDTKYITGGEEGRMCLMDVGSIEPVQKIDKAHGADVRRMTYHSNSNLVISSGRDKLAKIWTFNDTLSPAGSLQGHSMPVANSDISTNGTKIITGSRDNTVRLWDTETSKQLHCNNTPRNLVHCVAWLDDCIVAQGGENLKIYLWDTREDSISQSGDPIVGFMDQPVCMTRASDKEYEIYVGYKGFTEKSAVIRRFDIRKRQVIQTLTGHDKMICDVTHSNSIVTSVSQDCSLRTWDNNGTLIDTLMFNPEGSPTDMTTLSSHAVISTTEEHILLSKSKEGDYSVVRRYT